MIELRNWIESTPFDGKPWLLLGKGPTFSRRDEFPLGDYNLLGLNNVVGEQRVDVAHIIDVDVVGAVGESLRDNTRFLLMPRRPHVDCLAGKKLLEEYFDEYPILRELDSENRLVWYNAATSARVGKSPTIRVHNFSSEAAMNILGEMGVKKVRSLGIDGGTSYGKEFDALKPFGNGLTSFDSQFFRMEDAVRRYGIDYDPIIEPMRIFIGCDDTQIIAARVLEYTIRKHATRPVRVVPMLNVPTPEPKDSENRGRTGFSFARFHIPRLAGYRGKGLYVDADMQVFGDIAEVFDFDMGDSTVAVTRQDEPPAAWKDFSWFHAGRQMSVMLLDCERLGWDIDEIIGGMDAGRYDYADLLFDLAIVPEEQIRDDLPPVWNHLEHYEPGETKLLHYTVVPTQPWKNDDNPLGDIWQQDFEEAKAAGMFSDAELRHHVLAGHLKPSLAGRRPVGRAGRVVNRARAKAESLVRREEITRHPVVHKLGEVAESFGGAARTRRASRAR